MTPLAIAAITAAGAGVSYLVYKKVKESTFQTHPAVAPDGSPVQVATPVPEEVTYSQASGIPEGTPTIGQYYPVPVTVPNQGVVYAPPRVIYRNQRGEIHQPAPIIITRHGAASIAVGTVKNIQHALNTLGYCKPPLVEDGKLGPKTSNCIKAFQSKNGLPVDGNASPAVKAALSAALTHTAGGVSPVGFIVQNSRPETGTVVRPAAPPLNTAPALALTAKAVQHILNVLGASPPLAEDGKIGPKSVAAIKSFQTAHGILPDGVAGPKTKTALYLTTLPHAAA